MTYAEKLEERMLAKEEASEEAKAQVKELEPGVIDG